MSVAFFLGRGGEEGRYLWLFYFQLRVQIAISNGKSGYEMIEKEAFFCRVDQLLVGYVGMAVIPGVFRVFIVGLARSWLEILLFVHKRLGKKFSWLASLP